MNIPLRNSIIISPIGDTDREILEKLDEDIKQVFTFPTAIRPILHEIEFSFDRERNQYHSTAILEELANKAPIEGIKVLAITHLDLFIPILTHVYGEAQLGGKGCIVSTYRLKEGLSPAGGNKTFQQRVVREAIHELGHTFGLRHCKESTCIMHYCRSLRDVDRKSDQLCRYCSIMLEDELQRLRACQE
ncbi:MAG: archaemetzincin family Zn-dependent metalloprotease [Desulfatiglans sp.]|nr:archaemetzincin family Zn-dependent metalloprotease [Desulfatiglans sp.]